MQRGHNTCCICLVASFICIQIQITNYRLDVGTSATMHAVYYIVQEDLCKVFNFDSYHPHNCNITLKYLLLQEDKLIPMKFSIQLQFPSERCLQLVLSFGKPCQSIFFSSAIGHPSHSQLCIPFYFFKCT